MARKLARITGSTGDAIPDMGPRAAWVAFCSAVGSLICILVGADSVVTGLVSTITASGAVLTMGIFDHWVRPKLDS